MLENSLIQDIQGKSIPQTHKNVSTDWDEIKNWSDQVYMPYNAQPIGKRLLPDSSMHSVSVADMIVTRFKYGIPVYLDKWDQDKGHILLLTTIEGAVDMLLTQIIGKIQRLVSPLLLIVVVQMIMQYSLTHIIYN